MQRAVELFAVIQFTLMGLSHIVNHRAWVEFFIRLRSLGYAGVFMNGFLSLGTGAFIVALHPLWSGLPLVLTVFGVLNLAKAAQCFLLPELAMRSLQRVAPERSREFVVAGSVMLVIAAVVTMGMVRGA